MKFSTALSVVAAAAVAITSPVSAHGESHHRRSHRDLAIRARGDVAKRWDVTNGRATFYSTGLGACGGTNKDSDFIVALNQQTFGWSYPSKYCWQMIKISYGGKTTEAQIVDSCPGCPWGGLDMSPGLFAYFADPDLGVIAVDWSYVNGDSGGSSSGGGNDDGGDDSGNNDDGGDSGNSDSGSSDKGSSDNGNDDSHHDDSKKKTTSTKHHHHTTTTTTTTKKKTTSTTKKHSSTSTTSVEASTTSVSETSVSASVTSTGADATGTLGVGNAGGADGGNGSNLQSLEQVVLNLQHMIAAAKAV